MKVPFPHNMRQINDLEQNEKIDQDRGWKINRFELAHMFTEIEKMISYRCTLTLNFNNPKDAFCFYDVYFGASILSQILIVHIMMNISEERLLGILYFQTDFRKSTLSWLLINFKSAISSLLVYKTLV